jgi:Tfp pilus assembly protein PilN
MRIELIPDAVLAARERRRLLRGWAGVIAAGGALSAATVVLSMLLAGGIEGSVRLGPRSAAAVGDAAGDPVAVLQSRIEQAIADRVKARAALQEAMARLEANRALSDSVDLARLLETIAGQAGEGIAMTRLGLSSGDRRSIDGPRVIVPGQAAPAARLVVDVEGIARSPRDVSQFVLGLEGLGLFDRVALLESRERNSSAGVRSSGFRIQGVVEPGRPQEQPR